MRVTGVVSGKHPSIKISEESNEKIRVFQHNPPPNVEFKEFRLIGKVEHGSGLPSRMKWIDLIHVQREPYEEIPSRINAGEIFMARNYNEVRPPRKKSA